MWRCWGAVAAACLGAGPTGLSGTQEPAAAAAQGGRIQALWGPAELRIPPAVGGDVDARLTPGGLQQQLSPAVGQHWEHLSP